MGLKTVHYRKERGITGAALKSGNEGLEWLHYREVRREYGGRIREW
jgi:hypothetical protein